MIAEAVYVSRQRDLSRFTRVCSPWPSDVALVIHDVPGRAAQPGTAAVGYGADPIAMEPLVAEIRPRAAELAAGLAGPLGRLDALAGHELSANTIMTLAVDRVVAPLRRAIRVLQLCEAAGASRLRVPQPSPLPAAILRVLAQRGLEVVDQDGRPLPPDAPSRVLPAFRPVPRQPLGAALAGLSEPADLFVTAPHSDLYLLTVVPVLRRTAIVRPAILLLSHQAALAERFGLDPGRIRFLTPGEVPAETLDLNETAALDATLDAFRAMPDHEEGAALRALLADGAATRLIPMLHLAASLQQEARPHLERIASVSAAPGRLAAAAALVDLANAHGIASHEIQAGPISARRALPPNAATVFCMDEVSARTYSEGLGVIEDRLVVVGSPRIQELLAPWHRVSRTRARNLLARSLPLARPKLLLVATQPIGVEACRRMVTLALEACAARDDVELLLRPHPAEDVSYLEAYAGLLAGRSAAALAPAEVSTYLLVRASDWVLTYASTLGKEALMLGKPVIAVNPFAHPPPYDLAAAGAWTAASAEELAAWLAQPPREKPLAQPDSAAAIATAILGAGAVPP